MDEKEEEDLALLKVNGKKGREIGNYVNKLANAAVQTYLKRGVVRLRCVGPDSISNGDKAATIAMAEMAKRGVELVEKKVFTEVTFFDENSQPVKRSGIVKELVKR